MEQETITVAVTLDDLCEALQTIGRGGEVDWLSLEGVDVRLTPAKEEG